MTMQPGATRPVPDTTLPANGLSYVKGDTTSPLSEQTIPALLADTVARHGQRPAVVFREQGIRWTWQEFAAAVDAMARDFMRWACAAATASASGRRTAPNGC